MPRPTSWQAEAFNQVPDSENRIHSDDVARRFGFEGGLVPGVTVSAYLLHPAVLAWGTDWLERGYSHISVKKPLYDAQPFRVDVEVSSETSYEAVLVDGQQTRCAFASAKLVERAPDPQTPGDTVFADRQVAPTEEGMALLAERGLGAIRAVWDPASPMSTYVRDPRRMPELLSVDGGGYANAAFLLGLTNWILAANVRLGPWLHLETWSQNHAAVPLGTELIVTAAHREHFERKGHRFIDIDVDAFDTRNDRAVVSTRLRAIYRLRQPE